MFDAPRLEFGAIAEYDVASGEQTVGRFWILRFDFRGVGFAWASREIMGRVYKMMLLREFCDLLVTQRLHCRARRRFSFRCHAFHSATTHSAWLGRLRSCTTHTRNTKTRNIRIYEKGGTGGRFTFHLFRRFLSL